MFDGALVSVPDMPWSYLPTLFALQLPEVLLVLCIAAVVGTCVSLSRRDVPARRKTIFLMLTLAATLPLVVAMVKRPALYNGIRHFIFTSIIFILIHQKINPFHEFDKHFASSRKELLRINSRISPKGRERYEW